MTLTLQYVCHQAKLGMVLPVKIQNPFFSRCIVKTLCKVFKVVHTHTVETYTKKI